MPGNVERIMTLRCSDVCCWLLASSLLAAVPALAQKKTKPLTPAQQAEREKFDPKAEASPFGGHVVEESVAQVNDQIINTSDYNRAEAQLEQEGHQQGWTEQDLEDHKRDLLRDLIDQQLLLSRGKELDITGETELVRRLDEIRKQNHLDSMEDLEKAAAVLFPDLELRLFLEDAQHDRRVLRHFLLLEQQEQLGR